MKSSYRVCGGNMLNLNLIGAVFICISSELPLYLLLLETGDLHKGTLYLSYIYIYLSVYLYIKALLHPDDFLILIMQVLFCSELRFRLIFELQKQGKNPVHKK